MYAKQEKPVEQTMQTNGVMEATGNGSINRRNKKSRFSLCPLLPLLLLLLLFVNNPLYGALNLSFAESINMLSALETIAESMHFLTEVEGIPVDSTFLTSGSFDDSSWNFTVNGNALNKSLSLSFSGSLIGQVGEDITNTFSGTGIFGDDPFTSSGQIFLPFDSTQNDYFITEYDDAMILGSGSVSKTVRGAELIGGAVAGSFIGGWLGALAGAQTVWWISDVVDEFSTTTTPPPPPVRPDPPFDPTIPPTINDDGESIIINGNNNTFNKNRGNVINTSGTYGSGTSSGTIQVIPEPATVLMLGLGGLGLLRKRRA